MATKKELKDLETAFNARVDSLKSEINALRSEMATKIEEKIEPLERKINLLELSFFTFHTLDYAFRRNSRAFDIRPIYGYSGRGYNNTEIERKTPW
ncbi:MAG: hypothetical protein QXS69_03920 [Candidatus Aenigmatarchaeota archaeon]